MTALRACDMPIGENPRRVSALDEERRKQTRKQTGAWWAAMAISRRRVYSFLFVKFVVVRVQSFGASEFAAVARVISS